MVALSEDSILALIGQHFPDQHPSLLVGRGDDCCVMRATNALCVSADLFLEDVHFRQSYFSPREVGHKALAVNVSDIAACGARPTAFTLCLALPPGISLPWLEEFFAGMAALAQQHRMVLAGGDLSSADKLHISVTVWGEATAQGNYLLRGGCLPGDAIFVVGPLGLSRVGLAVLEAQGRAALEQWPAACAAHLTPQPQVAAGLTLGRVAGASRPPALMDVSDGLARDLPRLLAVQGGAFSPNGTRATLGAEIVLPEGLLHPEVIAHANQQGLNPVEQAFLGGEDYALLGACDPALLPALHSALPQLISIGTVSDCGNIVCNNAVICAGVGFDHFKN